MREKTVLRWFVICDTGIAEGPLRRQPTLETLLQLPGYRKQPGAFTIEQQAISVPIGNIGGPRAVGRRINGWQEARDARLKSWEAACDRAI